MFSSFSSYKSFYGESNSAQETNQGIRFISWPGPYTCSSTSRRPTLTWEREFPQKWVFICWIKPHWEMVRTEMKVKWKQQNHNVSWVHTQWGCAWLRLCEWVFSSLFFRPYSDTHLPAVINVLFSWMWLGGLSAVIAQHHNSGVWAARLMHSGSSALTQRLGCNSEWQHAANTQLQTDTEVDRLEISLTVSFFMWLAVI